MTEYNKVPRIKKTKSRQKRAIVLPDDFEKEAAIATIIKLAKTAPMALPPQDFTLKVMHRLPGTDFGHSRKPGYHSLRIRLGNSINRLFMPDSTMELASCFFLTGFFYLVLGISLYIGLKSLDPVPSAATWIQYQPKIALLTALGFATVGLLLLKDARLAFRIANLSLICYILVSIINALEAHAVPENPFSLNGILCQSAGTILVGIFLIVTLNNLRRLAS